MPHSPCDRTTLVAFFLGIDGGGSKTSCLIGDDSAVLGAGSAGPSNVIRVGEKIAGESLEAAIRQACAVAKITPAQIDRTCIGASGAGRTEITTVLSGMLSKIIGGAVNVVGDTVIALEAAFGSGPGVIVIAGTGSIAYGRNATGETARAGGWGYAISDEGSGHWIGRTAVSAVLHAYDEQQAPPLLDHIMQSWKLDTFGELIVKANASPPPDFAALVPIVLATADSGDPLARSVLHETGTRLAGLCKAVIRRLFPNAGAVPVAMSGGVFRNSPLVCQVFYNNVRFEYSDAVVNLGVIDPVRGALELARKGAAH
jgi:glucosamine kinase